MLRAIPHINIRQTSGALYKWAFEERLSGGKSRQFEIAVKGPLILNGAAAAMSLSAAVSGVGLTYTVAANVESLVEQGLLEACMDAFMPTMPGFFLYFPSSAQVLPKLRAFLDFWTQTYRTR